MPLYYATDDEAFHWYLDAEDDAAAWDLVRQTTQDVAEEGDEPDVFDRVMLFLCPERAIVRYANVGEFIWDDRLVPIARPK